MACGHSLVRFMTAEKIEACSGDPAAAAELRFPDVWLTTEEAAEFLRLAPATLKNWRSLGCGPAYHRGRPVVYSLVDLKAWKSNRRLDPIEK